MIKHTDLYKASQMKRLLYIRYQSIKESIHGDKK